MTWHTYNFLLYRSFESETLKKSLWRWSCMLWFFSKIVGRLYSKISISFSVILCSHIFLLEYDVYQVMLVLGLGLMYIYISVMLSIYMWFAVYMMILISIFCKMMWILYLKISISFYSFMLSMDYVLFWGYDIEKNDFIPKKNSWWMIQELLRKFCVCNQSQVPI